MNIKIIACVGKNLELGLKNDLIWKLREDLLFFKGETMGHYVLMGENTYKSLPRRLEGRKYIVLSQSMQGDAETIVFNSLDEFLAFAENKTDDLYVIGGGMVYKTMLPFANELILTEIDGTCDDADVYFAQFDKNNYNAVQIGGAMEENGVKYKRFKYIRQK